MKVMLTSFGIEQAISADDRRSLYHLMPPVFFRSTQFFMPDYELLLLCDRVLMDEVSFNILVEHPARAYSKVSETFRDLKAAS
jgi:hypothetical protein